MYPTPPIVSAARGWLGTRFHHQGRLKKTDKHKGGVDCLGLLIGVARELALTLPDGNLLSELDECHYPHHPDTQHLRTRLEDVFQIISPKEALPGDIALLRVDAFPQHLAIITDTGAGYGIIHAYAPARAVVEHALDGWWRERIVAVYRLL